MDQRDMLSGQTLTSKEEQDETKEETKEETKGVAREEANATLKTDEGRKREEGERATTYIVCTGKTSEGPWEVLGTFEERGQLAAKRAGAEQYGDGAEGVWFIAIPVSSYDPKKPSVQIEKKIIF